jgi:hypothetical protein
LVDQWVSLYLDETRAFVTAPSEETLLRVFMCSKVLLAQPFHGGKTKAAAVERIVARRIARWRVGQIQQLWDDMSLAWARRRLRATAAKSDSANLEREFRKVVALVNQGLPGKACRLLCSRGMAEGPDVLEQMHRLFPAAQEAVECRLEADVAVDAKAMQKILKEMPRGLAPGPSGLRADHLLQANQQKHRKLFEEAAETLARLARRAISGELPISLARWFCGGRGVPLRKKDGGVRPLVVGEVLRAAVSKLVLARCGEDARESLPAVQLGYSPGENGLQAAVRTARFWAQNLHKKVLLKVDISNAYNSVSRLACCDGAENVSSELGAWARWCLATPSLVSCKGEAMSCSTGVQQGEPLSPLLFCIGISPVIETLAARFPHLAQAWYLDDGLLYGTHHELAECIPILKEELKLLGLTLNVRKCELYAPEGSELPEELRAIPQMTNRSDWTYLGSPLWTTSNQATKAAAARALQVASTIQLFGKNAPLQALELLRHTAGACRVVHLCQAAPPEEITADVLQPTHTSLIRALEGVLECSITAENWEQASLPCRSGGMGLGDPTSICHAARLAALVNTTETAVGLGLPLQYATSEVQQALKAYNERWGLHAGMPEPEKFLQQQLMQPVQELRRAALMVAATPEQTERLSSVCAPHATDCLRGPGRWFTLTNDEARHAARWVIGVLLTPEPYNCPSCGAEADPQGLHAVACEAAGAVGRGHTAVKCVLAEMYRAAGARVEQRATHGCPS